MERVWLHHPRAGAPFHCPADAVEGWAEMGWVPGEAPTEVNLAVADRIAWEAEQRAAAAAATKSRKPAASGGTEKES